MLVGTALPLCAAGMGKSDIHITEKVNGERAERLRNLTNIQLVTVGLSSHPRQQLASPD